MHFTNTSQILHQKTSFFAVPPLADAVCIRRRSCKKKPKGTMQFDGSAGYGTGYSSFVNFIVHYSPSTHRYAWLAAIGSRPRADVFP